METKTNIEIPSLNNFKEDIRTLNIKYILFRENMEKLIELLGAKTGLPIDTMFEPGENYHVTIITSYGGSIGSPWKYSRIFVSKKDYLRRLKLNFCVDGTISVKLFWYDQSHEDIKYKEINPQQFLDLAQEIKDHLDP
jgi:hypothetical protein